MCAHKEAAQFGSFPLFGSSLSGDVVGSGAVDYAAGGVYEQFWPKLDFWANANKDIKGDLLFLFVGFFFSLSFSV